jgi:hypothetical protein
MNIENAGYVLANMDFSQLGVAGVVCALLFGGLVYAVNHFKAVIKDLKEEMKIKDADIKELNLEIRDMEISAITTINKFIEVQNKIYENTRRTQG